MTRTLGVDLGSRRIGIAVSDAGGILASPLTVLQRNGKRDADHKRIAELAVEEEVGHIVVGLPVALNGRNEIAAQAVLEEVEELKVHVTVPVETWDERMSTVAAQKSLATHTKSSRRRRDIVDKWAAANILQGWLDRQANDISSR